MWPHGCSTHKSHSHFLYLPPSFRLPFLTSHWPPGPAGCWRTEFSCLWWLSSPPDRGCPWSVRSKLAGSEGKRPLMSEPQTYSARERMNMWHITHGQKWQSRSLVAAIFLWKTFSAKNFSSISKSTVGVSDVDLIKWHNVDSENDY